MCMAIYIDVLFSREKCSFIWLMTSVLSSEMGNKMFKAFYTQTGERTFRRTYERAGRLTDRQAYTRNEDRQTCRQTDTTMYTFNEQFNVWRTKRSKDSESIGPFREYKRVNILADLWDSLELICLSIHE